MARWSTPIPLLDAYRASPDEHGVYEIGFYRQGRFNRMYIGRAGGHFTSIQSRLRNHANGVGNIYIAAYLAKAERNNLYCRWQVTTLGKRREASLLRARGIGRGRDAYTWNFRLENAS